MRPDDVPVTARDAPLPGSVQTITCSPPGAGSARPVLAACRIACWTEVGSSVIPMLEKWLGTVPSCITYSGRISGRQLRKRWDGNGSAPNATRPAARRPRGSDGSDRERQRAAAGVGAGGGQAFGGRRPVLGGALAGRAADGGGGRLE